MARILAVLLTLWISLASAQAWLVSRDSGYNISIPIVLYSGPGDVVSGARAYWLTDSCYTASYSGNVVDVANAAGTVGTRRVCASGTVSDLVSSTACTFVTGNACSPLTTTCGTCFIVNLYDQTVGSTGGGTLCGGGPCTLTMTAVQTQQPAYTANAIGTKHCGTFVGSSLQTLAASGTFTLNQPFTLAMMSNRTVTGSDLLAVIRNTASSSGTIRAGYANATSKADIYAGATIPGGVAASDLHFHSLNDVFDNSNLQGGSGISVDGAAVSSLSVGTNNGFSATSVALGEQLSTTTTFVACEAGVYPAGTISFTALYGNQVNRYGSFP